MNRLQVIPPNVYRGAMQAVYDGVKKRLAKFAGYKAATPSRTMNLHNRYATNPNSTIAQQQRTAMMWGAEYLSKNSAFGVGYLLTRKNYCSSQLVYTPDTGNETLDQEVSDYLKMAFARGGVNCSMQEAFSRTFDAEMPVRGDAGLLWDRREDGSPFLIEWSADQLGELYQFVRPYSDPITGWTYFAGMFFDQKGTRQAFKIYERGYDQVYTNPQVYPASDVIYGQDNIMRGIRGVTKFHAAIESLEKSDALFQSGMDAARRQAKTAVVVFNQSGMPDERTYDEVEGLTGEVIYAEKNADGAVVEYKYTGDSYMNVSADSPGPELLEGVKVGKEEASLALGFPFSFLVNMREIGGAPSRLEINKASKEITRIHNLHRPKLELISYIFILDAVDRGILPAKANITRGNWHFPTLPTADAFRESRDDIASNRAGMDTRNRIVASNLGMTFKDVLRANTLEAIAIARATEDANNQLKSEGYTTIITKDDIAQNSDNPQQSANALAIETNGKTIADGTPNAVAKMSAYIGDMSVADLPEDTRNEIARILGTNGKTNALKVVKYGMVASELERMADPHNLESAQKHLRYCTNGSCADEVHANEDKHVLVNNGRVVDGHHFLAKALKGKVSKSLSVIDLTPTRFQITSPTSAQQ